MMGFTWYFLVTNSGSRHCQGSCLKIHPSIKRGHHQWVGHDQVPICQFSGVNCHRGHSPSLHTVLLKTGGLINNYEYERRRCIQKIIASSSKEPHVLGEKHIRFHSGRCKLMGTSIGPATLVKHAERLVMTVQSPDQNLQDPVGIAERIGGVNGHKNLIIHVLQQQ